MQNRLPGPGSWTQSVLHLSFCRSLEGFLKRDSMSQHAMFCFRRYSGPGPASLVARGVIDRRGTVLFDTSTQRKSREATERLLWECGSRARAQANLPGS